MLEFLFLLLLLADGCLCTGRVVGAFTCRGVLPTHDWRDMHTLQRSQTDCLQGDLDRCQPTEPTLCAPQVASVHCSDPLETTWGCPQSGCEVTQPAGYGWAGPGCQVGNVALGKAASQSGAYAPEKEAFNLVDGDLYTNIHTPGVLSYPAFWQVDLGSLFVVINITVHNSAENAFRLNWFSVLAGVSEADLVQVAHQTMEIASRGHKTYPCPGDTFVARFVKLLKDESQVANSTMNILHPTEAIVMGYQYLGP